MTPILARNRGLIANVMQLARSESLCNRFSKGVWHKTPTPAQTQAPETPFRLRNARFGRRTQKVEPALQLGPTLPYRTPIRNEALANI